MRWYASRRCDRALDLQGRRDDRPHRWQEQLSPSRSRSASAPIWSRRSRVRKRSRRRSSPRAGRRFPTVKVTYTQDKSIFVNQLLNDLQNHVLIAVILVFIVILYALSGRASLLIGLAIPSSFLMGILLLALMGYTVNMIVLFSLILAVGMLVDDAIIVTEFAERRMSEGMDKGEAFAEAAKRMAGPVIAATLTRIAAFSPLLFWPGIVGDFMKYLPITLIVTLSASMALCADLRADNRRPHWQGPAAWRK